MQLKMSSVKCKVTRYLNRPTFILKAKKLSSVNGTI